MRYEHCSSSVVCMTGHFILCSVPIGQYTCTRWQHFVAGTLFFRLSGHRCRCTDITLHWCMDVTWTRILRQVRAVPCMLPGKDLQGRPHLQSSPTGALLVLIEPEGTSCINFAVRSGYAACKQANQGLKSFVCRMPNVSARMVSQLVTWCERNLEQ